MRKRRLLPPRAIAVTLDPAPAARLDVGGYDWSRFGRHRLRAPASVVIGLPIPNASHSSVATVWPDVGMPEGWARLPWGLDPHTGRGWVLPQQLASGDAIEFTATTAGGWVRWHGVLDSCEFDRWVTVQGPYPDAAAAHDDAQRLLVLERFLPALDAHARVTDCGRRTTRPRPRRHPHR
jgi:hypothetical protein